MSGGFGLSAGFSDIQAEGIVASPAGGTPLPSATNNYKQSWTQIVAATAADYDNLLIILSCLAGQGNQECVLVDIGIGPSGSEQVLVPNLPLTGVGSRYTCTGAHFLFPLSVPAGTRISARCQSAYSNSAPCSVSVIGFNSGFAQTFCGAGVDTYGANLSASRGITIDPGTTANTKGAWTQLTAATTSDLAGFVLGFGEHDITLTSQTPFGMLLDIGIGASGAEQVILPNVVVTKLMDVQTDNNNVFPQCTPYLPIAIPAGSRISARAAASVTGSNTRLLDVTLHGVRA